MKKRKITALFCFLFFGLLGWSVQAEAQGQLGSTHVQKLNIMKYGLTQGNSGFAQSQTQNTGEEINHIPITNHGEELQALAGIHYQIQKVEQTQQGIEIKIADQSTYRPVSEGVELVTDANGLASMDFTDGFYIVRERANAEAHLNVPAEPILLRLPVENTAKNGYLDQVYIYPKSSVDPVEKENAPKPIVHQGKNQKLLPKTGVIREDKLFIFGTFLMMTAVIFVIIRKKQRKGGHDAI